MRLFISMNSHRIIVPVQTPNVHLISYRNTNEQNKYILGFPISPTYSLGKPVHPLPCSHTPSMFRGHPHPRKSIPWQSFLALEGPKSKAYPFLKNIITDITCSWKSMDTIRYQCPTIALHLNSLPS